jgi:hypothetical protein
VVWEDLGDGEWRSAIAVDEAKDLLIDGFKGRQAVTDGAAPALSLSRVQEAVIRNCRAVPGISTFLSLEGEETQGICLVNNDLRGAEIPITLGEGVCGDALDLDGTHQCHPKANT